MIPGREEGYATPRFTWRPTSEADSGLDSEQPPEADHRQVSRRIVGMQSRSFAERQPSGRNGRKGMLHLVSRYRSGESY
jgi:hypothetical protein